MSFPCENSLKYSSWPAQAGKLFCCNWGPFFYPSHEKAAHFCQQLHSRGLYNKYIIYIYIKQASFPRKDVNQMLYWPLLLLPSTSGYKAIISTSNKLNTTSVEKGLLLPTTHSFCFCENSNALGEVNLSPILNLLSHKYWASLWRPNINVNARLDALTSSFTRLGSEVNAI